MRDKALYAGIALALALAALLLVAPLRRRALSPAAPPRTIGIPVPYFAPAPGPMATPAPALAPLTAPELDALERRLPRTRPAPARPGDWPLPFGTPTTDR